MVERVRVDVHLNQTHGVLDLPGVLVRRVQLPITDEEKEKFAKTALDNAQRMRRFLQERGPKINPLLYERIVQISIHGETQNPIDIFIFTPANSPRDFDTGVDLI